MPDVEQHEYVFQVCAASEIALNHCTPLRLFRLRHLGKSVPGKVDKHDFPAVYAEKVQKASPARVARSARQFAVARKKIYKRRLPDVRFARKGNFGRAEIRQLARIGNRSQKFRVFDYHIPNLLSDTCRRQKLRHYIPPTDGNGARRRAPCFRGALRVLCNSDFNPKCRLLQANARNHALDK